jgi:hypothetical protein
MTARPTRRNTLNDRNTGKSRDFWSKSESQLFRNPVTSSTCRSNSLSRQTGNFLERIRNPKRHNSEPRPTEQRTDAEDCMPQGLVPGAFQRYSDPFQSLRSLIVLAVSTAPIPLHPAPYRIIPPGQTSVV